jgi:alpha-tubulin suppressor-like RCC1 family protein
MISSKTIKSRAKSLMRAISATAVAALGGLTITVATGTAPALAAQAPGWSQVTTGGAHTCGIHTNSTLWCWGLNDFGQLGTGNMTTNLDRPGQVTTPARSGWASVAGGGDHTCAVRTGGTLWCWGGNYDGQLGIGGGNNQDLPQQVTSPARGGWARVTAGDNYTCAIRADSTLWCWGYNQSGDLGLGNRAFQVLPLPQQVTSPAPEGWASVTAG